MQWKAQMDGNLLRISTQSSPMARRNGSSPSLLALTLLLRRFVNQRFCFGCLSLIFAQPEFNRYRQIMAVEDCKMATKSELADKVSDINRLLNHKFTNEELNEKLRKQGSLDSKTLVFKRMETEKLLKLAKASGDDEEADKLQLELSQLTAPKLAFGSALSKPQGKKPSEHERLAEINLRNQKLNYENVRRAQLDERKASKKAAAAVARGEAAADPFMRVRTLAKTHHDAHGASTVPPPTSVDSGDVTPTTGSDTPGNPDTLKPGSTPQKKSVKGGIAGIRHRNMDDENIAALDLDLDIEI